VLPADQDDLAYLVAYFFILMPHPIYLFAIDINIHGAAE
jgi:hypothetical protein